MVVKNNVDSIPKILHYPLYAIAAIGLLADVLFNIVYGTIMFWQKPRFHENMNIHTVTFTHRLKRILRGQTHIEPEDFRFKMAHWICKYLLEPWDPGHCGLEKLDLK